MHFSKTFRISNALTQVMNPNRTWVRSMELPAVPYMPCCSMHSFSHQGQLCAILVLRQLCWALRLLPRSHSWDVIPPFPGILTPWNSIFTHSMIQTPEEPELKDILDYKNYKYFCYLTLQYGLCQKNQINLEVWKRGFRLWRINTLRKETDQSSIPDPTHQWNALRHLNTQTSTGPEASTQQALCWRFHPKTYALGVSSGQACGQGLQLEEEIPQCGLPFRKILSAPLCLCMHLWDSQQIPPQTIALSFLGTKVKS